jgi:hypothetical protein
VDNVGYVVAGYLVTAAAIAGYASSLFVRARRVWARAAAVAARRDVGPSM